MATFDEGYYSVGSYISNDYKVEIFEYSLGGEFESSPVELRSFIVTNLVLVFGDSNNPFSTHLKTEFQLQIIDEQNHFKNRFKEASSNQFYVEVTYNDQVHQGFLIPIYSEGGFWKKYNVRTFSFSNGLSILKTVPNSFNELIQIGAFFQQALQGIGLPIDLNMIFDYQHEDASGQAEIVPQQMQINPSDFVRNKENPSVYDAVIAVLEYFKLQIWNQDSKWWIVQRSISGSTPNVYNYNDEDGWTSELFENSLNILNASLLQEGTSDFEVENVSLYERKIEQRSFDFGTLNPSFELFESGEPIDWDVTGNVKSGTDSLIFEDVNASVSQTNKRVLSGRYDKLSLSVNIQYELRDDLTAGTYEWGVLTIKAINLSNPGEVFYLKDDASWSSTEHAIGESLTVPEFGDYVENRSIEFEIEFDTPASTDVYIVIELELTGDDVFVAVDPVEYIEVDVQSVKLSDQKTEALFSASFDEPFISNEITDIVYCNDTFLRSVDPTFNYYDGAEWKAFIFIDTDPVFEYLQSRILKSWMSQRAKRLLGYNLSLRATQVNLGALATISEIESGVLFTCNYYKLDSTSKITSIQIVELNINEDVDVTSKLIT